MTSRDLDESEWLFAECQLLFAQTCDHSEPRPSRIAQKRQFLREWRQAQEEGKEEKRLLKLSKKVYVSSDAAIIRLATELKKTRAKKARAAKRRKSNKSLP